MILLWEIIFPVLLGDGRGDAAAFFEGELGPMVVEQSCHWHGDKKQGAGLQLTLRESILVGAIPSQRSYSASRKRAG